MKILFAFLSCSFILTLAQAQYTCNDRTYLKQQLDILNANCGSTSAVCKAYNYNGTSLESAIAACTKFSGYGEAYCNSTASCDASIPTCKAYNYRGTTLESAIAACTKFSGYGEAYCNSTASCN